MPEVSVTDLIKRMEMAANAEDSRIGRLEALQSLSNRWIIPPTHRQGIMTNLTNWLLRKLFFAVKVFVGEIVRTQEHFNGELIALLNEQNKTIQGLRAHKGLAVPEPVLAKEKTNILVLNSYGIFPPKNGGQARLWNIYKRLAREHDITMLSIVPVDKSFENRELCNGLREILIPETKAQARNRYAVEHAIGDGAFDVISARSIEENPQFCDMFQQLIKLSEVVVLPHPFLAEIPNFWEVCKDKLAIFDSQNIEHILKQKIYNDSPRANQLVKEIMENEGDVCRQVDLVFTVSDTDMDYYQTTFSAPIEKFSVILNGVDINNRVEDIMEEKSRLREFAGISTDQTVCLFIGSWYKPNLDSMEFILKLAAKMPTALFFIIGTVYDYFLQSGGTTTQIPSNVKCFGFTDAKIMKQLTIMSDVALNPVYNGAGTSVKMFEYMNMEMPVIATRALAEKMTVKEGKEILFAETIEEYVDQIKALQADPAYAKRIGEQARFFVERYHSWDCIAEKYSDLIRSRKTTHQPTGVAAP